jgi:hypothetical protein
MKNLILFFVLIAYSTVWAQNSSGKGQRSKGTYFEETFFPVYVLKNDTETPAGGSASKAVPTQTGWGLDARTTLGYVYESFLLGLTYNFYSVSSSHPRTDDYEGLKEVTDKTEFGATVGYLAGHMRFQFTYFFTADKTFTQKYTDATSGDVTTDETHKNTGGKGYQLAVGYDFQLGAGFGVSPTLIYKTIEYSKQSYEVRTGTGTPYETTKLQTKAIDSELKPMITLNIIF